jgi:type IV pilus assembly protein PilW
VRYAVAQGDGAFPARLLTATQIDALDEQLVLHGANPQQRTQDRVRQSHWNRITAVHVAILLRGTQPVRRDGLDLTHDLFGMAYGDLYAASDPGTRVAESTLPPATRNRLRRVFSATVQVRNARADLS